MSSSLAPRIKRGRGPKGKMKDWNYRARALPYLQKDFDSRCGYSMRHESRAGLTCIEVDHFNPKAKSSIRNRYSNLFFAFRSCNNKKRDHWPTAAMKRAGIYFIDPTKERDYDFQIFENLETGELIPTTRAAEYHIEMLGLNDETFMRERRERTQLRILLESPVIAAFPGHPFNEITQAINNIKEMLQNMIPPIAAMPVTAVIPPDGT